jgi:hypothetical protein
MPLLFCGHTRELRRLVCHCDIVIGIQDEVTVESGEDMCRIPDVEFGLVVLYLARIGQRLIFQSRPAIDIDSAEIESFRP